MKCYRVLLEARGISTTVNDKVTAVGFVTTRWVFAASVEDGARKASEVLQGEAKFRDLTARSTAPARIEVCETTEVATESRPAVHPGYALFRDDVG